MFCFVFLCFSWIYLKIFLSIFLKYIEQKTYTVFLFSKDPLNFIIAVKMKKSGKNDGTRVVSFGPLN